MNIDLEIRSNEILNKLENTEKMLIEYSKGLQNVYAEVNKIRKNIDLMKDFQQECDEEILPIDESVLVLKIKSYPMNIRIYLTIQTNFGEISYAYDFPPFNEDRISDSIRSVYFRLLNELYETHEKRGGKFIGEEGCKDWMDKNGKTIVKKEYSLSPKFIQEKNE